MRRFVRRTASGFTRAARWSVAHAPGIAYAAAALAVVVSALVVGWPHWPLALAGAAVVLVVVAATAVFWRVAVPRLGPWTTGAALVVLGATAGAVLALAGPGCPGTASPAGRCSVADTRSWAAVGALAPLTAMAAAGALRLAVVGVTAAVRLVRRLTRRVWGPSPPPRARRPSRSRRSP